MSTTILTRPQPTYSAPARKGRRNSRQPEQELEDGDRIPVSSSRRRRKAAKKDPPPLIQKVGLAAQVYGIQGLMGTVLWFQGWREWLYPPGGGPNIVKAYEARPRMGVRIFFPSSYDLTSPQTLPTVISIHGGGFCIGTARDDDEWNRTFADTQNVLVISLPYSKAPRIPFPYAIHDLEVLYLAVLADESLPIDRGPMVSPKDAHGGRGKGKVAILGFDAGANLAMALSQLSRIRQHATPPTAVVSIAGYLDLERPVAKKLRNRPYKAALPFPRNAKVDPRAATYDAYVWSYVPYDHDMRDPLLSPAFAAWDGVAGDGGLPPHVCLVGAELDVLAHESWAMACRLVRDGSVRRADGKHAGWRVPDPDAEDPVHRVCGTEEVARGHWQGQVEMSELPAGDGTDPAVEEDGLGATKRFGFEVSWKGAGREEGGSVKWILVPDALHGFDRGPWRVGAGLPETVRDADAKTRAYVDEVGRWLRGTVWKS